MKRTALAALLAAPLLALAACSSAPSESDIVDDLTSDTSGWPQEAAECAAPKVLDQFTDKELEYWNDSTDDVPQDAQQKMTEKLTDIAADCGATDSPAATG